MITLICGVPGAGKSLFAVDLVIDELRLGNRDIITNLALYKDLIAEYLHNKYGDSSNTRERLIVVSDLQRFWELRKRETLFVLDECQIFFGARNWANSPPELLAYLSQHRKLGDDVIAITQHYQLIEKQFRQLVQESIFLKNLSYIKFFGVRMPKRIVGNKYYGIPATTMEKPLEVFTKSIDVEGICRLYDTGAGVGVKGAADKQRKQKGLPWFAAPVIFVVLLVLVYFGIGWFSRIAIKKTVKFPQPELKHSETQTNLFPEHQDFSHFNVKDLDLKSSDDENETNEIYTGFYVIPGSCGVLISDKRRYDVFSVRKIDRDIFEYVLPGGKTILVNWQEQNKKNKKVWKQT